MRELVLNHASIAAPDRYTAIDWLKDMASGISELRSTNVVQRALRMSQPTQEIICLPDWSLYEAFLELMRSGAREEFSLLVGLSTKSPILSDVDDNLEDQYLRCQEKTLPPEDGAPLLFCAISNGIAVGFPSTLEWDRDDLIVQFEELLPDESIAEVSATIDNLTRSTHAAQISERHRASVRHQFTDSTALWNARYDAFPNLTFDPDVKRQLDRLDHVAFSKVSTALARLETRELTDVKGVGAGILELRLHFGPGYRIYFGDDGKSLVILGCGTKQSQSEDIQISQRLWRSYKRQSPGQL